MGIFRKRPLCMILCMMLGGFALFWKLEGIWTLLLFLLVFVAGVVAFLLRHKTGVFLSVLLACLLLSFLCSHLYFDLWYFADRRVSGEREIEATVVEIGYAKTYGATFLVKTEPIDGIPFSRYRLTVHTDSNAADLTLGERIRFRAEILPAESSDGAADDLSIFGDGISGRVEIDNYTSLSKNESHPLRLLSRLRADVYGLLERVGGESVWLLAALFLGDKTGLSGTAKLDFRRIGISHLLAVSGMHLAILSAFLHRLLSLLGVGKKFRIGAVSLFVLFYMALTGFSSSVLRAGIMLLIASLLFLLAGTSDPLTTLSLAVFLLCLITPYSIFDVSLLLSALATLGILVAPKPKEEGKRHPVRHLILSSVISVLLSFFAVGATLAVTVFVFGRLSLLSAFSTLIFGFLVEIFMILGILSLPFGTFLPTEVPLSFLSKIILRLAGILSDLPSVYLAADFPITELLTLLFSIAFFLFLVLAVKRRRAALLLLLLLSLSVYVSAGVSSRLALSEDGSEYRSDTAGDCIVTLSDAEVSMLLTPSTAGELPIDTAREHHVNEIDLLFIPSYSAKLPTLLRKLSASVKLRCVVLPMPSDNEERFLLHGIESTLAESRTECRLIPASGEIDCGSATYRLLVRDGKRVILTLTAKGEKIAYLSRGAAKEDAETKRAFYGAGSIIFGSDGTRYRTPYTLDLDAVDAERVLLGSDDVQVSEEKLRAYLARGNFLLLHPEKLRLY